MKEQGTYLSGNACKQLYFSHWAAKGTTKAVIAMVHGYGEHSGRYADWAERFNERGIAFCAIDLPGHGKSSGKRGYFRSYDLLMKDIDVLLDQVVTLYPSVPVILYGHSMGGNVVINYACRRRHCYNLLIATSPWLILTKPIPAYLLKFIKFMSDVFPQFTVKSPLKKDDLSSIAEVGRKYVSDPLNHNRVSMKLLWQIIENGKNVIGQVYKITVPMYIAHGTADAITSYKASVDFARDTSDFITLRLWEGMRHELHHEKCQDQHFEEIMQWIEPQLAHIKLC